MRMVKINPGKFELFFRKAALFFVTAAVFFASCTSPRHLGRTAIPGRFLDDPAISDTHVGIAVYDAGAGEYVYTHNSEKFFVPASNVKIPTLYAGLKYLGDSIPGIRYAEYNDTVFLYATGDPVFMLEDFAAQPVFEFLHDTDKPLAFVEPVWRTGALGYGWPWNFYLNYYMPERSPFPVYGNVVIWAQRDIEDYSGDIRITYASSYPAHNWPVIVKDSPEGKFEVRRPLTVNDYEVFLGLEGERDLFVPFATGGMKAALELLTDTLHKDIALVPTRPGLPVWPGTCTKAFLASDTIADRIPLTGIISGQFETIYSAAPDSLFRPMMVHSDNFFAEQVLIMASNELFGVMDEMLLIEHLLENEFEGMPDTPRWVDGSGLSRYNLFSPRSFVWMLEKMKDEFGIERLMQLFPTGGEGTLNNLYLDEKGAIYAKTGTLGGNAVALSGFLLTQRGRTLIFSVLVNNHNKDAGEVRKATESFLKDIIYRF